ncbi:MAG: hypothetical protein QG628_855 [Patescibacteria group bacterium]|jgi:hypothetical protein|nr:hypothetical protein [Patescibacteria group bacterium]
MEHADSAGRKTPRDAEREGRWWSADVEVHTSDGPVTSANFLLLAGNSGSEAAELVAQHLGCDTGEKTEIRRGPDYGLILPNAIFSEVVVHPVSEEQVRILRESGNSGDVQLRSIRYNLAP